MRSGSGAPRGRGCGQAGFTYVWALAAVVVFSIGLAAIGPLWAEQGRREREQELMRIGSQYAHAIAAYRAASPGSLKQWPRRLEDLLLDARYAGTVRHLRTLYADPLDPERPWGIVEADDGGIVGVFSTSAERPLRRAPITIGDVELPAAGRYDEWKFVARTEVR